MSQYKLAANTYVKYPLLPFYAALLGEPTSYQLKAIISCLVPFLKIPSYNKQGNVDYNRRRCSQVQLWPLVLMENLSWLRPLVHCSSYPIPKVQISICLGKNQSVKDTIIIMLYLLYQHCSTCNTFGRTLWLQLNNQQWVLNGGGW